MEPSRWQATPEDLPLESATRSSYFILLCVVTSITMVDLSQAITVVVPWLIFAASILVRTLDSQRNRTWYLNLKAPKSDLSFA